MPKRLLQYALSRLEVFDTAALDVENLDIAWGKNSTFEFRDVGLRLKVPSLSPFVLIAVTSANKPLGTRNWRVLFNYLPNLKSPKPASYS